MDNNVLKVRGLSLFELSLVSIVVTLAILAVSYSSGKMRQAAFAQRAIEELDSIATASTRYYSEHGVWPVALADLSPGYLVQGTSGLTPFGNTYTITPGVEAISVSTLLPAGLVTNKSSGNEVVVQNQGNNDLVSITKSLESRTWYLKYEKKYIYKE